MHDTMFGWVDRVRRHSFTLLAVCSALSLLEAPASGTQRFGPLELSGNLETQNLIRHSSVEDFQFIQNRNTVRIRVDYNWLEKGKLMDRFELPFIERSKLYLLYRGVYDGFYDIAPGDRVHGQTRYDDIIGGRITDISDDNRSDLKWENRLREAYVDTKLKGLPLSFRIGRQQVIWGESDQFRIMDIWNPLDVSWHFQQEQSWDNIRIPLWMAKGLWDIGTIGPLSNTYLEVVYNPFDFQSGIKAKFLPQPWALPFPNPLRDGQIRSLNLLPNDVLTTRFDLQGTSLRQGDFERNPRDASEVGARFHFVTPFGLELAANYMYGRGRGVGAASPFAVRLERLTIPNPLTYVGRYQTDINDPNSLKWVIPLDVDAKVMFPYMHIFGLTGNIADEDYTQTVFRFETAYAMGEPYQTTEQDKLAPITRGGRVLSYAPFGYTRKNIWTGMIGFDRPTWIRFLNPKATWFLSGQFFWHYIDGHNVDKLVGNAGAGDVPYFGPIGVWNCKGSKTSCDPSLGGQVERQQDGTAGVGTGDNIRQWEHLITFAATSFYKAGTIVPFVATAWDPVNDNFEALWYLDYYYTNNFIVSLSQKYFMKYGSKAPSNDPWFAGGRFARRDETGIKLTYQF